MDSSPVRASGVHFTLIISFETLPPNTVTWRVKASKYEFWRDTIQSIADIASNASKTCKFGLCMVVHTCYPEAEAGGLRIQGQSGLHRLKNK
jgi:hypothetical protein